MKQNNLKKIIFFLFLTIVIFFFAKALYQNFSTILYYDFNFTYWYLLLSIICILLVVVYFGILRIDLVREPWIPFFKAMYIHLVSWLAKYIPGKAGIILSKVYFLSELGIEKKRGIVISIYENVFQILSVFVVSIPLIVYYFLGAISSQYMYIWIIFVVLCFIFLHPTVFYQCINLGLKLFKKQTLEKKYFLSYRQIIKYFLLYTVGVFLNGFAFYFMVKGITDISFTNFLPLLWAWNFAGVIWLLAIFAPGWLGVREWVLVIFLKFLFPLEVAILISVFSRFWVTAIDGIIGLYVLIIKIIHKKKKIIL